MTKEEMLEEARWTTYYHMGSDDDFAALPELEVGDVCYIPVVITSKSDKLATAQQLYSKEIVRIIGEGEHVYRIGNVSRDDD